MKALVYMEYFFPCSKTRPTAKKNEDTVEHTIIVVMALLAISEALSLIPQVKSNGVFQVIYPKSGKKTPCVSWGMNCPQKIVLDF